MATPAGVKPDKVSQTAKFVCLTCKTRKKRCNKLLPSCTYCISHSLQCKYVPSTSVEKESGLPAHGALRALPPAENATPWTYAGVHSMLLGLNPSIKSALLLTDSFLGMLPEQSLGSDKTSMTVDSVLYFQVRRIISTYGKYVDSVSVSYFQGIHRWLPVISRRRFHDRLMNLRGSPTADISVLLLAMCLVTSLPSSDKTTLESDLETLYLSTKMLFAHAQSFTVASTSLIQASLLISTYEYAQGLLDAAYISSGTCARMAIAVGLDSMTALHTNVAFHQDMHELEEQRNLWWGIILCERFIAAESDSPIRPFFAEFPPESANLPLELDMVDQHLHDHTAHKLQEPISALKSASVCSFGREAQAAYLYDTVLKATTISDHTTRVTELQRLDVALQEFLAQIIAQSGNTWGLYCGSIAFTIGALFTLHEYILGQTDVKEFRPHIETSKEALAASARMVVDVARSFNANSAGICIEALPPRYSHLANAAIHLLQSEEDDEKSFSGIEELRKMLKFLNQRWIIAGRKLEILDARITAAT